MPTKGKIYTAQPQHEVLYQDICALVSKHQAVVTDLEMLAIAANMVGKLIALMDQRAMSPEMAMEIVTLNIQQGNEEILKQLHATRGSA